MPVPVERRWRLRDLWPATVFGLTYLLTLSRTLSITHDSALLLRPIETLEPTFVPNHLWFEPVMTLAYRLLTLGWPGIDAQQAVELVNAVAGAAALQAAYVVAVWRLGLSRRHASLAVTCAGFTYGVWYYSIAIETYVLPLALTAWTFVGLTSRSLRPGVVVACAVAHSAAILCHQSAVLFGAPALVALISHEASWRTPAARAAAYFLIVAVLVGAAYTAATIRTGHAQSLRAAARWSTGHLPRQNFWARPPRAFVLAAAGVTRAMVGGQFVFAAPTWDARISGWFPRKDPIEERFFVRTLTPRMAWLCAALSVFALGVLGILIAMAAATLWRHGPRIAGRESALLAVWLAVYCAFFTLWDPANPDFWVVQVYLTPLLTTAVLQRAGSARLPTVLFPALAVSLFVVNGLGTVRLARDPANDYYRVYLGSVARLLHAGDVLILGDHWPVHTHVDRLSPTGRYLSREITSVPAAGLAAEIRHVMDTGRRVFIAPDALEPTPAAVASYGPRYATYLKDLRTYICGLAPPLGGDAEMPLREVTCVVGSRTP
jgi:hypothetical protein